MRHWVLALGIAFTGACDGGGRGGSEAGEFRLIQFLDSNRADIARNHAVTLPFSEPVAPGQDLSQRLTTEIAPVEAALIRLASGATIVDILGDLAALNPSGAPARDSFVRIEARYEYDNGVEAVTGPFASMDRVDLTISVNG